MGIGHSVMSKSAPNFTGNPHGGNLTPISCVVCSWHHSSPAAQSGILAASGARRFTNRLQRPLGEATCNTCPAGRCSA